MSTRRERNRTKTAREAKACPRCRRSRWRTVIKGQSWACRWCGYTAGASEEKADAA